MAADGTISVRLELLGSDEYGRKFQEAIQRTNAAIASLGEAGKVGQGSTSFLEGLVRQIGAIQNAAVRALADVERLSRTDAKAARAKETQVLTDTGQQLRAAFSSARSGAPTNVPSQVFDTIEKELLSGIVSRISTPRTQNQIASAIQATAESAAAIARAESVIKRGGTIDTKAEAVANAYDRLPKADQAAYQLKLDELTNGDERKLTEANVVKAFKAWLKDYKANVKKVLEDTLQSELSTKDSGTVRLGTRNFLVGKDGLAVPLTASGELISNPRTVANARDAAKKYLGGLSLEESRSLAAQIYGEDNLYARSKGAYAVSRADLTDDGRNIRPGAEMYRLEDGGFARRLTDIRDLNDAREDLTRKLKQETKSVQDADLAAKKLAQELQGSSVATALETGKANRLGSFARSTETGQMFYMGTNGARALDPNNPQDAILMARGNQTFRDYNQDGTRRKGALLNSFFSGFLSSSTQGELEDQPQGKAMIDAAKSIGRTVKYNLINQAVFGFQNGLSDFADQAMDFQRGLTDLRAAARFNPSGVFGDKYSMGLFGPDASSTSLGASPEMNKFIDQISEFSRLAGSNVGDSLFAAARGMRAFGSEAGLTADQVKEVGIQTAQVAGQLAVIANKPLKDATGDIIAIGKGFDLTGESLKRIPDAIAYAKNTFGGDERQIAQGLANFAETAKTAGLNTFQAANIISAVVGSIDESGQAAATRLSRIFSTLTGNTGRGLLTNLGIDTGQSQFQQLAELAQRYRAGSPELQGLIRNQIGGTSSVRELLAVFNSTALEDSGTNAGGQGLKSFLQQSNDIVGLMKKISGDIKSIVTDVVRSGILAPVGALLKSFESLLRIIDSVLKKFNEFTSILGPLQGVLGAVVSITVAVRALNAAMMTSTLQVAAGGKQQGKIGSTVSNVGMIGLEALGIAGLSRRAAPSIVGQAGNTDFLTGYQEMIRNQGVNKGWSRSAAGSLGISGRVAGAATAASFLGGGGMSDVVSNGATALLGVQALQNFAPKLFATLSNFVPQLKAALVGITAFSAVRTISNYANTVQQAYESNTNTIKSLSGKSTDADFSNAINDLTRLKTEVGETGGAFVSMIDAVTNGKEKFAQFTDTQITFIKTTQQAIEAARARQAAEKPQSLTTLAFGTTGAITQDSLSSGVDWMQQQGYSPQSIQKALLGLLQPQTTGAALSPEVALTAIGALPDALLGAFQNDATKGRGQMGERTKKELERQAKKRLADVNLSGDVLASIQNDLVLALDKAKADGSVSQKEIEPTIRSIAAKRAKLTGESLDMVTKTLLELVFKSLNGDTVNRLPSTPEDLLTYIQYLAGQGKSALGGVSDSDLAGKNRVAQENLKSLQMPIDYFQNRGDKIPEEVLKEFNDAKETALSAYLASQKEIMDAAIGRAGGNQSKIKQIVESSYKDMIAKAAQLGDYGDVKNLLNQLTRETGTKIVNTLLAEVELTDEVYLGYKRLVDFILSLYNNAGRYDAMSGVTGSTSNEREGRGASNLERIKSAQTDYLNRIKEGLSKALGLATFNDANPGATDDPFPAQQRYLAALQGGDTARAEAEVRIATRAVAAAKSKGGSKYWEAMLALLKAQDDLAKAQRDATALDSLLKGDFTDPMQQAAARTTAAKDALDYLRKKKRKGDIPQAELEYKKALQDERFAGVDQSIQEAQAKLNAGEGTRAELISAYELAIKNLELLGDKSFAGRMKILDLKASLKNLRDSLGQFNFGDIKLPTPYEVRRLTTGVSDASKTQNINISINGADMTKVYDLFKYYFGSASNVAGSYYRKST